MEAVTLPRLVLPTLLPSRLTAADTRRRLWNRNQDRGHRTDSPDSAPVATDKKVIDSSGDSNGAAHPQPTTRTATTDHGEVEASELGLSLN